jgi:hypothetical protein
MGKGFQVFFPELFLGWGGVAAHLLGSINQLGVVG